jgi:hypothetical protein
MAPKLTNPTPLRPYEVSGAYAVQLSTTPQLSSTMSLTPYEVTGPLLITSRTGGREVAAASGTETSKEQQVTSQLVGPGWTLWRGDETRTSAEYVPEGAGTYRFQARWRKATEHRVRASNTPRTVKVVVKHRAAPATGSGASDRYLSRPPAATAAGLAEESGPGSEQ